MKYRAIVAFESEVDPATFLKLVELTGPIPLLLILPEIFDSIEVQYQESEEKGNAFEGQRRNNASSH